MFRLKRHDITPPGLYGYEQKQGIYKKFERLVDIYLLAQAVTDFRQGNKLLRATFAEALQDCDEYKCFELGGMPKWCHDSERSYVESTPRLQKKIGGGCCGARVK